MAKEDKLTSIQVHQSTKDELRDKETYPKEPFELIILRLLAKKEE